MKFVSVLARAAAVLALLSACGGKEQGGGGGEELSYTLDGPLALELPQSGGSQKYTITTDASWQVIRRSAQNWAEARPVSGSGNGTFTISAVENTSGQERTMKFSIYLEGEEQPNAITLTQKASETIWDENGHDTNMSTTAPSMGIRAFDACNIMYRRGGKTVLNVSMSAPVIVGVADQEEQWGFFQFPGIAQEGNTIKVGWQMNYDTEVIVSSGRPSGKRFSTDGGETWHETGEIFGEGHRLPSGNFIRDNTQRSKDVTLYSMPSPIVGNDNTGTDGAYTWYEWDKVDDVFKGWYLLKGDKNTRSWTQMQSPVYDPGACVHAVGKWLSVALYGNFINLSDGSLLACVYGVHYAQSGNILDGGATFYRSTNEGQSWTVQGKIPFETNLTLDPNASGRRTYPFGYSESCAILLQNGKLLHVTRTGGPMYRHLSSDSGKTWSHGVPFTPNGVRPHLLQLGNGVVVMSSGRPGVQLRFSIDGNGEVWTDPFEMLSYPNGTSSYDTTITCGYAPILACGNNSFYIVYSDFKYKTSSGAIRKAIKFRKVTVNKAE